MSRQPYRKAAQLLAPSLVTGQPHHIKVARYTRHIETWAKVEGYADANGDTNYDAETLARRYSRALSLHLASKVAS